MNVSKPRKRPAKPAGEIGSTKVTAAGDGTQVAELLSSNLPTDKEELELQFATGFVSAFNLGQLHIGSVRAGQNIEIASQNDTSDLDFNIISDLGDYLELAEIAPIGEPFGRVAFRTGKFHVLEMARWIYRALIQRKFIKYGDTLSSRTVLLLYVTNWQFYLSDRTIECLASLCLTNGCKFSGVYFVQGNGLDLNVVSKIWPWDGIPPPSPKAFRDFRLMNGRPGQASWDADFADLPTPPADVP